ncbi:MAG: hypothetical protein C0407_00075, partial [Desulfobacca sp.]|nr:hypothetical protein [Desulfobacca sp.]
MGRDIYGKLFGWITPPYGNWGGPGHDGWKRESNGDYSKDNDGNLIIEKPPINTLDWIFYRHDEAYRTAQTQQEIKNADRALVNELTNLQNNPAEFAKIDLYGVAYIGPAIDLFNLKIKIESGADFTMREIKDLIDSFPGGGRGATGGRGSGGGSGTNSGGNSGTNSGGGSGPVGSAHGDWDQGEDMPYTPLILDLNGDGVKTVGLKGGAYFDHDKNGFAEQTGWASSDDGILVMDRNIDGIINDGGELFGNGTALQGGQQATDGFQALSELDTNADGKVDFNDTAFSQLRIWQDADGDGYSSPEELYTLSELGIQSINTSSTNSTYIDPQGNEHRMTGSFTKTDGTTSDMADVWFKTDKTYSLANDWLDVPDIIAATPNLQGYGTVYDLHQAMVRDSTGQLKSLVDQFGAATDTASRSAMMDQIIFKWTGSETVDPGSRGIYVDARKLVALEKLFNEPFQGSRGANPVYNSGPWVNASYKNMFEMYYAQMMAQTHLKDIYEKITYTWDETTNTVSGDLSPVVFEIQNIATSQGTDAAMAIMSELVRSIYGVKAEGMLNLQPFVESVMASNQEFGSFVNTSGKSLQWGSLNNDILAASVGDNVIWGRDGDDLLNGSDGFDILYGGEGDDTLSGGAGNDTLDGGAGNDFLSGGWGDDTYLFGRGSGNDTIDSFTAGWNNANGLDTVQFGEGITQDSLDFYSNANNNLYISIKDTGETLTLDDFFQGKYYYPDYYRFTDGTTLTPSEITNLAGLTMGTAGNDILNGDETNNIIDGGAGNDIVTGGAGNDIISGGEGNDTLDGGSGNDLLRGGSGDDTYLFGRGSGNDTIENSEYNANRNDTVQFGADITQDSLDFQYQDQDNSLVIRIRDTEETLTLDTFFAGDSNQVGNFHFDDGTTLTASEVIEKAANITGTDGNDTLTGVISFGNKIYGLEGEDNLTGGYSNDLLDGGEGKDTLRGGAGDDNLLGGSGDDSL